MMVSDVDGGSRVCGKLRDQIGVWPSFFVVEEVGKLHIRTLSVAMVLALDEGIWRQRNGQTSFSRPLPVSLLPLEENGRPFICHDLALCAARDGHRAVDGRLPTLIPRRIQLSRCRHRRRAPTYFARRSSSRLSG